MWVLTQTSVSITNNSKARGLRNDSVGEGTDVQPDDRSSITRTYVM